MTTFVDIIVHNIKKIQLTTKKEYESLRSTIEKQNEANEKQKNENSNHINEINSLKQTISDLETRLLVLHNELSGVKDCNERFNKEREELTTANHSLSTALMKMKKSLLESDEQRKILKEENVSLQIQLSNITMDKDFKAMHNSILNTTNESHISGEQENSP